MSNETKPTPPRNEIRVKQLWFSQGQGREMPIPGPHGGLTNMMNGLIAGKNARGDQTEITYIPQQRHHRVVYLSANGPAASKTFYVHESWCVYEAVE